MPMTAPIEALLFIVGNQGLSTEELADILQLNVDETRSLCHALQEDYDARGAGLQLVELAGSWQLVTRPEYANYIRRLATAPMSTQLSNAALEVLSIVAYNQPISRSEVERIRGVQSDGVISTLAHRQLIEEVGRQESPGRPILYGTTDLFLQTFGLRTLAELPELPPEETLTQDVSLFNLPAFPRD